MMTHWKKLTNPDYLGAYSIENGQELILTIGSVKNEVIVGADGKKEECTVCRFKEPNVKPMILNSTNMKMITKLFNTPYIEEWSGKQIQIGVDKVKAFGEVVEALRVRKILPAPKSDKPAPKCSDCSEPIQSAQGMSPEQMAEYTTKKYDRPLCAKCAIKANQANTTVNNKEENINENEQN